MFRYICINKMVILSTLLLTTKNKLTMRTLQTKEAHRVQGVPFVEVEQYDNLADITIAANSGKMISLCNLSQLVNQK